VARDRSALLLNFFLLGEYYQRFNRYDFAALLYYRTIEESLSERLRRGYGGFDLEHPDYALLSPDLEDLTTRYQAACNKVFGGDRQAALPWQVALVDALVLLHVLNDELLRLAKINGLGGIGHVRGLVKGRNRSVLAHGDESVTVGQCRDLRARALLNLRAFWALHHAGEDVEERIETLRFVDEA
jgi:CRISPR-associated protein (Cas_Cas02710).